MKFLQTPIASDLSYEVLKLRQRQGELNLNLGDTTERLFHVPSMLANRERFVPHVDEVSGDSANPRSPISGLPVRAGRER